jgi:hypothetical protein
MVMCKVDENTYSKGVKIENDVFEKINLEKAANLSNWNYIIRGLKIGNKLRTALNDSWTCRVHQIGMETA